MSDVWIVNASPMITLAKIGRLGLVESLAGAVVVPEAVAEEIMAGPEGDLARKVVEAGWGRRGSPKNVSQVLLEWGLGKGETAVIALAMEAGAVAVLDDASARAAARTLGLEVIGTIGIVARAKLRGLIPAAAPVIADLRGAGLHLDERLVRSVLERVGEKRAS